MSVPTVIYETFETTPEFASLRAAVATRSWPQLERALSELPGDQVTTALVQLGDVDDIEGFLEAAVASDPSSAWARTALATRYIALAWAVRSRYDAQRVSRDQFRGFFEWLGRAEELLEGVNIEQPGFAPAWAAGLYTVRGLQLSLEELARRHSELSAITPHDYPSHLQTLQMLLPKWSGSWKLAGGFVRQTTDAAPAGANIHALVPLLHIEMWMEETDASRLKQPATLAELREASARFAGHGRQPLDPVRVQAHNAFFMAFWLGKHNEDAAAHVRALGGRISEFPWRYKSATPRKLEAIQRGVLGEKFRLFGGKGR